MSEIAKCPVCGSELSGSVDGIIECKNGCSFRCGGYALPRISAAMELAKAEVASSNIVWSVPLERLEPAIEASEDMLFQARLRVLEVFK